MRAQGEGNAFYFKYFLTTSLLWPRGSVLVLVIHLSTVGLVGAAARF